MGVLKHFSGVVCGQITAVHNSNDVTWRRQPLNVKRVKGAWPGLHNPVHFWSLNASSSKMAKDTKLKFGMHDPM